MQPSDVITLYRQRADDAVSPYHVSDEALLGFVAEAEEEACIRAKLILDSTSDFLTIPIVAGIDRYDIEPCLFDIETMNFVNTDGAIFCMARAGTGEMAGADRSVQGRPFKFAFMADHSIGIWPLPNTYASGNLQLVAYRTPEYPVESLDDDFEIHERWHRYLVDWLMYRVYSSKDREIRDPERAAAAYDDFETRFGIRRPADIMRRHREKRPATIPYSGY